VLTTSNLVDGEVVPMPTLPPEVSLKVAPEWMMSPPEIVSPEALASPPLVEIDIPPENEEVPVFVL